MDFDTLRCWYHNKICQEIIRTNSGRNPYPNFADKSSKASRAIASSMLEKMDCFPKPENTLAGQTVGKRFEEITRDYIEQAFAHLHHIRPGQWQYSTGPSIADFEQYQHLAFLDKLVAEQKELASALGKEHIIKPDIVVARIPIHEEEINAEGTITAESVAKHTPLRAVNNQRPLLHACISCKWTLRNDRSQNTRSEALSLIRHRKGHIPHIVAVTAEPLPTRIAALALGTGDIDCVYHFALYELESAIDELANEDQLDMLTTLIDGHRLRDISDLPFDLAI